MKDLSSDEGWPRLTYPKSLMIVLHRNFVRNDKKVMVKSVFLVARMNLSVDYGYVRTHIKLNIGPVENIRIKVDCLAIKKLTNII